MRASAQIGKISLLVEGDHSILGQVADEFYLVGFILFLHELNSFPARQLKAFQLVVGLDDLLHFLLDGFEVLGGECLVRVEVIVEARIDGRPDGQLDIGAQSLDRLG